MHAMLLAVLPFPLLSKSRIRCSEGILAGEMKHGPLALVDEHMPVLAVATCDAMWGKMQSVIAQLLARKSQLIVMCNEGDRVTKELCASHACQIIEVSALAGAYAETSSDS